VSSLTAGPDAPDARIGWIWFGSIASSAPTARAANRVTGSMSAGYEPVTQLVELVELNLADDKPLTVFIEELRKAASTIS
jgi:hypothetical protein